MVDMERIEYVRKRIALLEQSQKNAKRSYDNEVEKLRGELRRSQRSLAQIERQIALQDDIIKNIQAILAESKELVAKGYIAKIEYNARKERQLNHIQQLSALKRQKIELSNEIERYQSNEASLELAYEQQGIESQEGLLSLKEQLISIEQESTATVVAPIAGAVSGVQAIPGNSVGGRIPLLSIVPEGQNLFAQLYVPAQAIGFVKEGLSVKLMFDAYDYRKFGAYEGKVAEVTKTLFLPSEVGPSVLLSEPVYRVTVELKQQVIYAYGEAIPLRPNMRLKADISLASRRLYEWFLDPFNRFQKAT